MLAIAGDMPGVVAFPILGAVARIHSALSDMQHDIHSLPQRITLARAAELAGYTRKNTIRENFLGTVEDRSRLEHRYNHLGEATVDTKRFLEALEKHRSDRAKRGNWRLANLELAHEARQQKRARKQNGRDSRT